MERITVLYLIDVFKEIAGAERNLYEVATRLNKEKFCPIVMCLQGGYLVQSLRDKGIEIYDLDIKKIYSLGAMIKAVKIFNLIKKKKVKIVVTYHESSDFFGSIIAKIAKVPVIISSRRDMGYKLKPRHIFIYKLINRFFDRIITVSDAVADVIFERENVLWSRIKTIHNGVEIEKFNKKIDTVLVKRSIGIKNDFPVVGILAAIRPIKGHRYFLEAASLILKHNPNLNFLVVGWYDENMTYFNELQRLVEKLGIKDKVIFTGGRKDTPEMLSIMDICVISSINEGFPNAVLEAMAIGKSVVATNSGGTPEAVVDGDTGILVEPSNSDALTVAITGLLEDNKLRLKMGQSARGRIEAIFKIEAMISKIEILYEEMIALKQDDNKRIFSLSFYQIYRFLTRTLKIICSTFLYYSGILFLWQSSIKKEGVKFLSFHRINNNTFDPINLNIKTEIFEKQIRMLKRKFNIISFEKAIRMIENKHTTIRNAVVITFDDGFADNYINAFPLLRKYNIPAIIFLSVQPIVDNSVLWFQKIVSAFYLTKENSLELNIHGKNKKFIVSSLEKKYSTAKQVVYMFKDLSVAEKNNLIKQLVSKLKVRAEDILIDNKMLNWEQIREMRKFGITFGSHGMRHDILTKISSLKLLNEIQKSKDIIEQQLGEKVEFFAYPNGAVSDFNEETIELLRQNKYKASCTLMRGINRAGDNLFCLNRDCVTRGMSENFFGRFSKALFVTELSGMFGCLR